MMLKKLLGIGTIRRANDLQSAIETVIKRLRVAHLVTVTFDAALFTEDVLTHKAKQKILRVIRKRLHDIVKYTNASEVYVSLRRTRQRAYLVIGDNRRGLDITKKWAGLYISDIVGCLEPETSLPKSAIHVIAEPTHFLSSQSPT